MAKYGSKDIVIKVDSTSGGSLQDMTSYITSFSGLTINQGMIESTPFGAQYAEQLAAGFKTAEDITIGGFYDDTASTGPDAVFKGVGETRSVEVTWGGSKKSSFESIIKSYSRQPQVGELTKFEVVLTPIQTISEA